MNERFIDLLKLRENYRMASLPSVDIVTFSLPTAATSQKSIKGFIHGRKKRHNAILGYFPDPDSDDGHWKIQWQPIPGRYWQHDLIKGVLTESSLLPDDQNENFVRVDYRGNSSKFPTGIDHVSSSRLAQPI